MAAQHLPSTVSLAVEVLPKTSIVYSSSSSNSQQFIISICFFPSSIMSYFWSGVMMSAPLYHMTLETSFVMVHSNLACFFSGTETSFSGTTNSISISGLKSDIGTQRQQHNHTQQLYHSLQQVASLPCTLLLCAFMAPELCVSLLMFFSVCGLTDVICSRCLLILQITYRTHFQVVQVPDKDDVTVAFPGLFRNMVCFRARCKDSITSSRRLSYWKWWDRTSLTSSSAVINSL